MLEHALQGWLHQTERPHEIIVAWDGDVPKGVHSTHRIIHIAVPRTGPNANRNGARNAAAAHATGTHLWFVDGDFIPEATCIENALLALAEEDCALSPVLVGIRATWEAWTANPYPRQFAILANQWSGFAELYRPEKRGATAPAKVTEGFPLVRSDVFWELGGFDASYTGWGANKEEFIDRLRCLHEFYPYKLLVCSRMYHQPHASEGDQTCSLVLENQKRRTEAAQSPNLVNLASRVRVLCGF